MRENLRSPFHIEPMRLGSTLLVAALLQGTLLLPSRLGAQSGTPVLVVNVMTPDGKPVEDALVRIRAAGRLTRTNWMGEATMHRAPRGRQRVEVVRLGYAPAIIDLVIEGDTLGAQFVLERLTDTLSTMWITAARPNMALGALREYTQRKRMGIGRFVDDTVFEKHAHRNIVLVLPQLLPGIRAQPAPPPMNFVLRSTRAGNSIMGGPGCAVDVYLDGFLLTTDLEAIHPSEIAGAELYPMAAAPPQFRRQTGGCHVLLLWSRW